MEYLEIEKDGESIKGGFKIKPQALVLAESRKYLEAILKEANIEEKDISKVILATDESLANIIEHAVMEDGGKEFVIEATVYINGSHLKIVIKDPGVEFNPGGVADPNMKEHLAAGKKGGLGIFIIRKIMDKFQHEYIDGYNVITMEKTFS